ncbi:hypothetical protein ACPYO6_11760 [Georgenia sp. Z1344]|uniref:hypothetical protein n=1 Tax=Georgenia sp. Z1344 TaxID=3416706 RepID=UPI003CF8AAE3
MDDDFVTTEQFVAGTSSRHAAETITRTPARIAGLLVATALVYWPLFALAGIPWSVLVALGAAAVSTALIAWLGRRAARDSAAGLSLTLSPDGLEYVGDSSVRRMAWDDVRAAEVIPTITPLGGGAPTEGFSAFRREGLGLVGRGTTEVTGGPLAERTYAQDPARYGTDPDSGESRTAIPLSQFDEQWARHRIGEWVAHHRPDVARQAAARAGRTGS